ncbi:hypothetical protein [Nocardioides sp. HB32]
MTTNTGATERAKETASTAADEGRHVAGVAKEEATNVAATAADQARSVMGDAVDQVGSQLGEQATTQRDRLSGTLRTFGDDLEQMASQSPSSGLASNLAHEVAERARSLGAQLESREPRQLLDDARDFARRRPGTFLLGALAAGVVAGRLFRGAADGAAAASLAPAAPSAPTPTTPVTPPATAPTGGARSTGAVTTTPPLPPPAASPTAPIPVPGQPVGVPGAEGAGS